MEAEWQQAAKSAPAAAHAAVATTRLADHRWQLRHVRATFSGVQTSEDRRPTPISPSNSSSTHITHSLQQSNIFPSTLRHRLLTP